MIDQQQLLTMCCSVRLLYVFVYILRADMLDVEEIPYSPPPVMSSHTTVKLILFYIQFSCCIPRHLQCTLIFYWPPSNLNLTTHRSRWNDMKFILLLMLLFYTVAAMTCFEDHCLSFYPFFFCHCVVDPSMTYVFCSPL